MIEMSVDGLDGLVADLRGARDTLGGELRASMSREAANVKRGMRADMARSKHFHQVARTINYDLTARRDDVEVEIGPANTGAGDLAHFAYFGGANGGGGTVPDPEKHLGPAGESLERHMSAIIKDFL